MARSVLSLPLPAQEEPVGKWEASEPRFSYVLKIFSHRVNMFDSSRYVAENFSVLVSASRVMTVFIWLSWGFYIHASYPCCVRNRKLLQTHLVLDKTES